MRIKNYLRMLLVVVISLTTSSLTRAQDDSIAADSIMELVPLDMYEYGDILADPIARIGHVVVLRNRKQQLTEINGIKITAPIWAINLTSKEILFDKNVKTVPYSYMTIYDKRDSSIFFMIDGERQTIFKIKIDQNKITYEVEYVSTGLLNSIRIEEDGTIFITESWNGIKTIRDKKVIDSFNLNLDIYSTARKDDVIYFGGDRGLLGSIIMGTGEIVSLQNNMNWFGGVLVYNINNHIYATGSIDGGKNGVDLFKFNFDNKLWNKITEDNVYTINWDNMYKKYTTSISSIKGDVFFENDLFIPIPTHPYESIMTPEKFRNTQYEYYSENIGRIALGSRAIFEFDGKTYGIGWGIIGTYEMVSTKEEDTTGNVHASEQKLENVSLYPNPATNFITIPNLVTEVEASVYDISGHLVLLQKSSGLVDISTLNPGLYLIRINGYKPEKFYKN